MALTRVLITVKTYPTISTKYEELVCTAGFSEEGSWIRIYPVQYRKKSFDEQYKKYDWVEVDLVKNALDFRPESFRPRSHDSELKIIDHIDADGGSWQERRAIVLQKVYTNLTTLINEAKDKKIATSLATFKPKEIQNFIVEPCEREWSCEKLDSLRQMNIFETVNAGKPKIVRKLPYKFSYQFIDEDDRIATLMIEDWELGQLYWKSLARHEGDEFKACADVRKKYFDDFVKTKDLYLFLGTSQQYHFVGPNPFMIIGIFYPKFLVKPEIEPQLNLFD
jgi:hypothetical protein